MRTIECEKCSKRTPLNARTSVEWLVRIEYGEIVAGMKEKEHDLCPPCQKGLRSWFSKRYPEQG